jgi:predicted RNase H-like nuclease (RuvC/YqgF family)
MPKKPTRSPVAAIADRAAEAWRDHAPGRDPEQDRRLERRLERAEARIEHLEAALEDLQDALYRQAQRADESHEELLQRTDTERIARELSDDARRRGL